MRHSNFTGKLLPVTVTMHDDQDLDGDSVGDAQMAKAVVDARVNPLRRDSGGGARRQFRSRLALLFSSIAPQAAHSLWAAPCSSAALPAWHVAI
jgi:hypothetical protein